MGECTKLKVEMNTEPSLLEFGSVRVLGTVRFGSVRVLVNQSKTGFELGSGSTTTGVQFGSL